METIDKTAQGKGGSVFCDEGAARLYGGEGELGLWLMVWRWHVYSCDGCTSALEGCVFFPGITLVTELDHGVRVHAWAQGLRWRACELATDS